MQQPSQGEIIAEGKTKTLYSSSEKDFLIMEFRNDTSAFDGGKQDRLDFKGAVNNAFNAFIMELLANQGIAVHHERRLDDTRSLVRRLDMIPLEAVVRNLATGSLCRRLGVAEKLPLSPPVFEFFYKDDELGDPMINESHAKAFGWADAGQMRQMQEKSLQINEILRHVFDDAGLILVDYKLEFGVPADGGDLVLGDEFTPDGCRIWQQGSGEKLDKDRFRQDLGAVIESYRLAAELLGVPNLPDAGAEG